MLPGIATSDSDLVAELLAQEQPPDREPGSAPAGRKRGPETGARCKPGGRHRRGARHPGQPLEDALSKVLPLLEGAFSLGLIDAARLVAVRDPHGFRPLCLGRLRARRRRATGWVDRFGRAPRSRSSGRNSYREIEPGEMVVIDEDGPHSSRPIAGRARSILGCASSSSSTSPAPTACCTGKEVHRRRRRWASSSRRRPRSMPIS